ncbi:MAG: hypothetical protein JOZ19_05815 [Rubrobacter sp.]|nr:hypothetical protein [Rubrobacter sp.]
MDERSEQQSRQSFQGQSEQGLLTFLQELRVVLPGVQVLFAFLLTVPFSQRFHELTQLQQYVFYGSLLCTTAATLLLIAPSAHHRLLWYQGAREPNLRLENKLTIAGLIFLGPSMSGVIFLITDMLFNLVAASTVTVVMIISFLWLWFALPVLPGSRSEERQNHD